MFFFLLDIFIVIVEIFADLSRFMPIHVSWFSLEVRKKDLDDFGSTYKFNQIQWDRFFFRVFPMNTKNKKTWFPFEKFIWVNNNNSLTLIKAIWGRFPLLTMIPVRSQWGRYNLFRFMECSWWFVLISGDLWRLRGDGVVLIDQDHLHSNDRWWIFSWIIHLNKM